MLSNKIDLFYGFFATAISTVVAIGGLMTLASTAIASHDEAVAQQCTARTVVATRA